MMTGPYRRKQPYRAAVEDTLWLSGINRTLKVSGSRHSLARRPGAWRLAVEESPLPDFKIDEHPQSLRVVLARRVARRELAHVRRIENAAPQRAFTQDVFLYHRAIPAAKPTADRHGEAHLLAGQNPRRQHSTHRPPQHIFRRPTAQLHRFGQTRRELHQLVIEKRHAAFERRG